MDGTWRRNLLCMLALVALGTPCLAESEAVSNWKRSVSSRLEQYKHYPADGHLQGGEARVGFTLDRSGLLLSAQILKSSDVPSLDAAAIDIVKSAAPFPAAPPEVDDLKFAISLIFVPREQPAGAGDRALDPTIAREEALMQRRLHGICRGC